MAFDSSLPVNSGLLINAPAQIRANWDAIATGTDASLLVTNAKVSASAAIADSKLAQITTASKVSGTALTLLANIPSGAGNIPVANLGNAPNPFVAGDWIISTVATAHSGWSNVSGTYINKMMRIHTTALSTGGADTVTVAEANLPSHTHAAGSLTGGAHTHSIERLQGGGVAGTDSYSPADTIVVRTSRNNEGTAWTDDPNAAYVRAKSAGAVAVTGSTGAIGSGTALATLPAYVTVITWQKDA